MQAGNSRVRRNLKIATVALLGTALTPLTALAQDATWKGPNIDYGNPSDWTPGVVPTGTATFSGGGPSIIDINLVASIDKFLFDSSAQGYLIANGQTFTFNGAAGIGIDNQSPNAATIVNYYTMTFNNASVVGGAGVFISNLAPAAFIPVLTFNGSTQLDSNVTLTNSGEDAVADGTSVVGTGAITDFNDTSSADGATISQVGGSAIASGLGGAPASAYGGGSNINFNDSSHADNADFSLIGGGSAAVDDGGTATSIGGSASLKFNDSSHADSATFSLVDGGTTAVSTFPGISTLAIGGTAAVSFTGTSHADDASFDLTGLASSALGSSGRQGAPGGTGEAGGTALAIGGIVSLGFDNNSHADGASITLGTGNDIAVGGAGGPGDSGGAGGTGGQVQAFGANVLLALSNNAHVNNATIATDASASTGTGGAGGSGANNGMGGAGGGSALTGGIITIGLTDNASVDGTVFTNTGGNAVATGGTGGTGSGLPNGAGGRGGNSSVTGASVNMIVADDVVLGAGTQIYNTAGDALATGGTGGTGFVADGGRGGNAIATGGNATVTFEDNASAGSALIVNTGGAVTANGGNGGDGGPTGNGGDGGVATAIQGVALVNFTDASTGGSAHIMNHGGLVSIQDTAVFGTAAGGGARIDNVSAGFNDPGVVVLANSGSLGNALLVNGDGTNSAIVTFFNSATAGTSTITNNNFGSIGFNASSTLGSATITNNAGGLVQFLGSSDAVAGSIVNAGGSLSVFTNAFRLGSLSGTGTVSILSTSLQVGYLDRDESYSGLVEGPGQLVKRGTGTFTLSGANIYSGGTTIADGTLQLDNLDGAGSGIISLDGGNLRTTVSGMLAGPVAWLAGSSGVFSAATGTTVSLTGALEAFAAVGNPANMRFGTAGDTGTIEIDSFSGAIADPNDVSLTVQGGTLRDGGGLLGLFTGFIAATTIDAGATLDFNGFTGNITNLQGAGTLTNSAITNVSSGDFAGTIAGAGPLSKITAGTLVLSGTNTYTGSSTITGGVLQIGNGGTSGTLGTGDVIDNASLVFDRSDSFVVGNAISGSGTLTKLGAGTLALTGTNTYTGGTTISAGTLQIGNGGTTGSIAGDVLDNANLSFNRSDTITYGGGVSGTGTLTKIGADTLVLTGANTYTGTTTISAGTLQIGNGGTTGSIAGNVIDNANLTFNRSDTITYGGGVSGTGTLTKVGAGTLVLTNANTHTGGTTISAGTLQIGNGGTTGSIAGNVIDNANLAFNRSDTITYGGVVSGTGTLTKLGAGTLILTGANTYAGPTTISAGTLQIGNGGTTGSIAGNVVDNANLAFNRSDTITYGGVVSGTGSLTKAGAGTLVLSGANTYTGATTVSAGTLRLTGSVASNTTVNAGTVLDGTGTINGALIVNGTVAPGTPTTPFGTLTVTGNAAFNAGSFLQPTISAAGSTSLLQAGSLTINGGQVKPVASGTGFFLLSTDYHIATGTGGVTGTFGSVDESLLPTFLDASLLYSGTGVTLRLRRNVTTFGTTPGLTPNQAAVGGSFDAAMAAGNPLVFTTYGELFNTLLAAGQNGTLASQLETLSGNSLTAHPAVEQRAAERFGDRLEQYTWSNSSNLWGLIAYADQQADPDGNGPGFKARGPEFQIGFNTSLAENTRLGLSVGYSRMNLDSNGLTGDVDTWSVGLRGRQDFGGFYAAAQGTYNWHKADSTRVLLSGSARGSYDAKTWTLGGELGGVLGRGRFAVEPFASVRHAETSQDAFSEAGSIGALDVAAEDYQTTRYGAGIRLVNRDPTLAMRFNFLARYEHESGDDGAVLDNALPGLPAFQVVGTKLGDNIFSARAGVEFQLSKAASLFGSGGGSWRGNETNLNLDAGLRIRF